MPRRVTTAIRRAKLPFAILALSGAFLLSALLARPAVAALRWTTPKKTTITVRLLMELPQASSTTGGRNRSRFVAEEELPRGDHRLVELSYEYMYYEPPLAEEPLDEHTVYRLRAIRDQRCDENLAALGDELGLSESSVKQAIGTSGPVILECYRTEPHDYLSAHRTKGE